MALAPLKDFLKPQKPPLSEFLKPSNPRGYIRTKLEDTFLKPSNIVGGAKIVGEALGGALTDYSQKQAERRSTQTFGEQAFTELVKQPAKILGKTAGFIGGALSETGKTIQEFVLTYGKAALGKDLGQASLEAQATIRGTQGQQELEKKLFGFNPKSYADYQESISEYLEKQPDATPAEKKYLPFAAVVAMFAADLTPFGRGRKLGSNAVKELIAAQTDDLAKTRMIKYGLPEELAERAAKNVARAKTAEGVETAIKGEAAFLMKQAEKKPLQQFLKPTEAPTTPKTAPETAIAPKTELSTSISKAKASGQSLVEEARKYKSAEEFADSIIIGKRDPIVNGKTLGKDFSELKPLVSYRKTSDFLGYGEYKFNEGVLKGKIGAGQELIEGKVSHWKERISKGERPIVIVEDKPYVSKITDNLQGGRQYDAILESRVRQGHSRLEAYKQLGIKEVPVVYKSQLTDIYNQPIKGVDNLTSSIKSAKQSGQSFDEWVKGQGETLSQGRLINLKNKVETPGIGETSPNPLKGTFELQKMKVKDISFGGQTGSTESIASAKRAIQEGKELPPITINPKGQFALNEVMDGNHRLTAYKQAGIDEIDVLVKVSDDGSAIIQPTNLKTRSQLRAEWDGVGKPKIRQMRTSAEIPSLEESARRSGVSIPRDATGQTTLPKGSQPPLVPVKKQPALKSVSKKNVDTYSKSVSQTKDIVNTDLGVPRVDRDLIPQIRKEGADFVASYKNPAGDTKYAIRDTGVFAPKAVGELKKDIKGGLLGGQSYNLRDAFFEADNITLRGAKDKGFGVLAKTWEQTTETLAQKGEFVSSKVNSLTKIAERNGVKINKANGKLLMDALEGKKVPANISKMAEEVRVVLDGLRKEANVVRKALGKSEIGYIEDYAPHLQETGFWSKLWADKRTTISDAFDYIIPNAKKNPHALPRKGGMGNLETDFFKLYDSYLEAISSDIYITKTIEQLKAVNQVVKANGLNKLSKVIEDTIRSGFVGKPGVLDKMVGLDVGTKRRMIVAGINQARNISALAGNLVWTFVFQPASFLGMTFPRVGGITHGLQNMVGGAVDFALNPKAINQLSSFRLKTGTASLGTTLAGDVDRTARRVAKTKIDSFNSFATYLSDQMEYWLSGVSGAAGMREAKRLGLKSADQKTFANYVIEGTQSAYNKEARPRMLQNLSVRAVAPFQTFAFELYRFSRTLIGQGGGLPLEKSQRLNQIIALIVGTYVYNEYSEKMTGRKLIPSLPVVGSTVNKLVGKGLVATGLREQGYEGGDRSPVAPLADFENILNAGKDYIELGKTDKLRKELTKWGMGFSGIGGAATVNRFVDGMIANAKGFVETRGGDIAFPVEGIDKVLAPIVGPYSTRAGIEYSESFDPNSAEAKADRKNEKRILPLYNLAQEHIAEGEEDKAQAIVDALSDEDYETYKKIKADDKKKEALELQKQMFPVVKSNQKLLDEGKKDEAQAVVDALSDEEYKAYQKVKKSLKETKKVEDAYGRSKLGIASDYVKAFTKDPANAFRALFTKEKLGLVEGNLVELQRFYGVDFRDEGGSQEYKRTLMASEGIPWSEASKWKLEHITPVKAGGSSADKNLMLVDNTMHDFFTPVDIAVGNAVRSGIITRKKAEGLMTDFKVNKVLTAEEVLRQL